MELPLPLVPVHTRTERRLFNQMMLRATRNSSGAGLEAAGADVGLVG
jgi:hypothetical protein